MIAIISDIHGNYPALSAVFGDIRNFNISKIYSLGDVAGYYSMINECIELLRGNNVINILGNHDYYIIKNERCPRSNSANISLDYQRKMIEADNLMWLKQSVSYVKFDTVYMVHGGWQDNLDEYMYNIPENYLDSFKEKFFFSGHTHIQKLLTLKDKIYCNPGSVGQPRDGDWRAAYAILNEKDIKLRRVEYDVVAMVNDMKLKGFDQHFYKNLFHGTRLGGKIDC
ncbi:MAG: metallophosphoesterase family protein [Candidatus Thorarchaeota archaeon]